MPVKSVFSTLIYRDQLQSHVSRPHRELLEEAFLLRDKDEAGKKWSKKNYPSGFTSYGSMDELHKFSSPFWHLKTKIDKHAKKYLANLEFDVPFGEIVLTKMWVNVMGEGCSHSFHLHPLSVISGTYYVQVPKASSAIKFEDPRASQFMGRPSVKKSSPYLSITPKAGELLLFESWLKHEVPPHPSKTERVSVSFNYDWIRS